LSEAVNIGPNYRKYALGILLVGYIINFVDRSILSLLLEPIKLELALSDSQLGFLGGLAFAVFYTFLGIPIAALADRRSRVKILAVSMVIWSAMTAVCGLANNFITLLLARIGVGIGEAGASPPSHSLISDYFPIETRATALSIYALGIPLGTMIGSFVGGWGADAIGWRYTFFLVGVPGVIFALIVWFTLREPPRGMSDLKPSQAPAVPIKTAPPPPVKTVLKLLWSKTSFRHLAFAAGLHAFVSYGAGTWNAPFFIRIHDMSLTEIGSVLALIAGIGAIGTFFGGYISDKLSDRTDDKRWYFWVPGIATLVMVPFQLVAYLYGGVWAVVASLMMVAILGNAYLGPSFAMTQALVSLRMRAVASAILLFVLNLIGMGLGPYLVGVLSDILTPDFGIYSIRYAMCAAVMVNLWAACHYFIGARTMRGDLADTQEMNEKLLTQGDAA
jgi:MFS family permease|tara:strand:+ start:18263 stop:19600 length:1338 start_codon:yes stop_codon:yes gene_type:complete